MEGIAARGDRLALRGDGFVVEADRSPRRVERSTVAGDAFTATVEPSTVTGTPPAPSSEASTVPVPCLAPAARPTLPASDDSTVAATTSTLGRKHVPHAVVGSVVLLEAMPVRGSSSLLRS